jgi:hypothetical protein
MFSNQKIILENYSATFLIVKRLNIKGVMNIVKKLTGGGWITSSA